MDQHQIRFPVDVVTCTSCRLCPGGCQPFSVASWKKNTPKADRYGRKIVGLRIRDLSCRGNPPVNEVQQIVVVSLLISTSTPSFTEIPQEAPTILENRLVLPFFVVVPAKQASSRLPLAPWARHQGYSHHHEENRMISKLDRHSWEEGRVINIHQSEKIERNEQDGSNIIPFAAVLSLPSLSTASCQLRMKETIGWEKEKTCGCCAKKV